MISRRLRVSIVAMTALALGGLPSTARAREVERPAAIDPDLLESASANGKYSGLLGTLEVPEDEPAYGAFHDWGPWPGGPYAGVLDAPAGFWVYVAPRWYVWRYRRIDPARPDPRAPTTLPRGHPPLRGADRPHGASRTPAGWT